MRGTQAAKEKGVSAPMSTWTGTWISCGACALGTASAGRRSAKASGPKLAKNADASVVLSGQARTVWLIVAGETGVLADDVKAG